MVPTVGKTGAEDQPANRENHLKDQRDDRPAYVWMATNQLRGIGVELMASIIGLGLVGLGADRVIWGRGWTPYWCTFIGLMLGLIGGLYNAIKKARAFFRDDNDNDDDDGKRDRPGA